ncbi:MAG: VOC family protein [Clostridiales bacterium]|nr:VOC family protein [Clostridiales bacterium]
MRICPYISFNGNCNEAVAFYENAFNVKAEISRYKDAPPGNGYAPPAETENYIMHAQFEVDGAMIMLCDMPPDSPAKIGDNIAIMAEFDSEEKAKAAFNVLKDGGNVSMEIQETFWSKCFGSLTDKFGINWNISIGCPQE